MLNKSPENPIESNSSVVLKKAGKILRTGVAGGLVGIAASGGVSAQTYSPDGNTGIDQGNYAIAPAYNNKTVDLDNPVYTTPSEPQYPDMGQNNYAPASTYNYGSVNFDYPTYTQSLESLDSNKLLDDENRNSTLGEPERTEMMEKAIEEGLARLSEDFQELSKQARYLQELLNDLNKRLIERLKNQETSFSTTPGNQSQPLTLEEQEGSNK